MMNPVQHESGARAYKRRVFYTGADALNKGTGLCYERDFGVAAAVEGRRDVRVERPSADNNMHFAGVTANGYMPRAGGQWIEIYEPGSVCEIAIGIATTVKSTILTCSAVAADAGRFTVPGLIGRGTALALQTVANDATGLLANVPVGSSLTGAGAWGAGDNKFTHAAQFAGGKAGDTFVALGGCTLADGSNQTTQAALTVSADVVAPGNVVVTTAGGPADAQCGCGYLIRGNPTCLAYLFDGPESGLQQFVSVDSGAEVKPAPIKGGTVRVISRTTGAIVDTTFTLTDAVMGVNRTRIIELGTIAAGGGQKDIVVTPTGGNIVGHAAAAYSAVATFKMHTDKNFADLEWDGMYWNLIGGVGAAA